MTRLTKQMWDDFLEYGVDSSDASGWKWFEENYGLNHVQFGELLLENQEKAEKWDKLQKEKLDKKKQHLQNLKKSLTKNLSPSQRVYLQKIHDSMEQEINTTKEGTS